VFGRFSGDDASLRALKLFMENIFGFVVCVGIYVPLCREICSRAKLLHMARGENRHDSRGSIVEARHRNVQPLKLYTTTTAPLFACATKY
jgi:hypothetical protein